MSGLRGQRGLALAFSDVETLASAVTCLLVAPPEGEEK